MKSTTTNHMLKRDFHLYVEGTLSLLKKLKQQDQPDAFQDSIIKILPGIKRYIAQRLKKAISTGSIPAGKYSIEDFINDLYIIAYDHILIVKEDKDLYPWLFKKAVEVMEDVIIEEDFDQFYFKNIDNYTKAESEEMEEKYSTDGDGDFVMEEELDDLSYSKHDYQLEDVFVENIEDELISKLNTEHNQEIIQRHIEMVVNRLPLLIQVIYQMEAIQKFKPEEIAYIKDLSLEKVKEYLTAAKTCIRVSLEQKYLAN